MDRALREAEERAAIHRKAGLGAEERSAIYRKARLAAEEWIEIALKACVSERERTVVALKACLAARERLEIALKASSADRERIAIARKARLAEEARLRRSRRQLAKLKLELESLQSTGQDPRLDGTGPPKQSVASAKPTRVVQPDLVRSVGRQFEVVLGFLGNAVKSIDIEWSSMRR